MAISIDNPPSYVPITKEGAYINDQWGAWTSTLPQVLSSYLSEYGMFVPQLTQKQINSIQGPQEGQFVFNSTIMSFQGYVNGVWEIFPVGADVVSAQGTENQVLVNGTYGTPQTGAIVLSGPQDLATTSSPTFASVTLTTAMTAGYILAVNHLGAISAVAPSAIADTYTYSFFGGV